MGFEPTTLGLGSQCSTTELISQKSTTRFTKKRTPMFREIHRKDNAY